MMAFLSGCAPGLTQPLPVAKSTSSLPAITVSYSTPVVLTQTQVPPTPTGTPVDLNPVTYDCAFTRARLAPGANPGYSLLLVEDHDLEPVMNFHKR